MITRKWLARIILIGGFCGVFAGALFLAFIDFGWYALGAMSGLYLFMWAVGNV